MLAHVAAYSAYATPGRVNQFTFAARQCVAKLIFKIRKSPLGGGRQMKGLAVQ